MTCLTCISPLEGDTPLLRVASTHACKWAVGGPSPQCTRSDEGVDIDIDIDIFIDTDIDVDIFIDTDIDTDIAIAIDIDIE